MKYLIAILVVHWIADFILQSDQMAKNKSKSNVWLLKHIGAYTLGMTLTRILFGDVTLLEMLPWLLVNGAAHFLVDWVTSRITSELWCRGEVHNFFVVVGLDQMVHLITLIVTFNYMVRTI